MTRPRLPEEGAIVAIVGGGFGGLSVAKKLGDAPARVVIFDRTNHHLFQPLLYQVATATLAPGDISAPIRQVLSSQMNTIVIMGEVENVDAANKTLYVHGTGYRSAPQLLRKK